MIDIRPVTPADYETVGKLTADVYIGEGFASGTDRYAELLRDTATRAEKAEVMVAEFEGQIVGSVTIAAPGSPFADVAEKGELEFRMLAVAKSARGRGVGSALVRYVLDVAYDRGDHAVIISTMPDMVDARRIYDRNGFVPAPERNWEPAPGIELTVLVRELA
ncbi:GNAT family N-acetyltransferase [Rhodococcus xishaensis]|uniref:GNAT family N-acetyltransferase n=1 Tax=Rhodococcus xishaensis TaxID=2487364 RepID=A0A3S3CTQ2_9NOCA|nr:GNAT family N-acetyltransferase [Rhodococcus xishaensis]RVW05384.1 GNAT family N-acetyltransferase [Rhodococcus xishaensis]